MIVDVIVVAHVIVDVLVNVNAHVIVTVIDRLRSSVARKQAGLQPPGRTPRVCTRSVDSEPVG